MSDRLPGRCARMLHAIRACHERGIATQGRTDEYVLAALDTGRMHGPDQYVRLAVSNGSRSV